MRVITVLAATDELAAIVFIDIAIIIVVARLMGAAFRRIRQPAVVGEIIAGIALGPSLLGLLPGDLPARIFPTEVRPFLGVIAQLGLIIFMFIVGLELDLNLIRGKERVAAIISVTSVVLPFGLGLALATYLHPRHDVIAGFDAVEFLPFALFLGAAMSITAFPVLARILTDRGMNRTPVGALALACAAVDDILAWSLLAVVVAIARGTSLATLPTDVGLSVVYIAAMFLMVKPLLARLGDRYRAAGKLTPEILAVVLIGILVSSYTTDRIGIHAIFGAFTFGAVMPRKDTAAFFHELLERLEQVTVLLLLPVFFIATGLNVDIRGLGAGALPELGLILLVAIGGKFIGATVAARAQGVRTQQASAIGVLMNTRGLTELVILNVGLSIGVLDQSLFTMMVIMAIVTTVMTGPLLRAVYPEKQLQRDIAEAERAALGIVDAYRILVVAEAPENAERLVDVAVALVGDERPAEIVLSRLTTHAAGGEVSSGLVAELAAMAGSMGALNAQARRVEGLGIPCTVLSRFSGDIATDLLAQSASLEADVILLDALAAGGPERRGFLHRLFSGASTADVAVLVDPAGRGLPLDDPRRVAVTTGDRPHDDAAAEAAVRLARGVGAEVLFVDDPAQGRRRARKTSTLVEDAGRLAPSARSVAPSRGVDAELAGHAADRAVVVVGIDAEGLADGEYGLRTDRVVAALGSAALVVAAATDQARGGLAEMIRRLERRRSSAQSEEDDGSGARTEAAAPAVGDAPGS
jgi:Kef-type K+ transport system membrane component KefB